ncbi:UvrD-helicase domain-containing protein [Deinococcus yavapaiensis]|uniref:DNA 3'-5' helicase n=1 Tax=Deinococcus yavapaiensis KR-236 TaxID=694435 RepID=A0A318SF74_9DEIO|nr:UvrD-helicase domain-containing protein [Deinococcus yavapaiensis]PYE52029.1 ATP-dependent exoDNAse (exonuclease V) beta subunit [Deinococcus yavapaiensis KR-236]
MTTPHPPSSFDATPQQRAAVHALGSVAIDAGAGSGKTRVMAERIVRLLDDGVQPGQILATTFTMPAAAELRARVETYVAARDGARWQAVADALPLAQIGTIHALCARILREHPVEAGVGARFTVLDEAASNAWPKAHLPLALATLDDDALGSVPVGVLRDVLEALLDDPVEANRSLDAFDETAWASARAQAVAQVVARQAERDRAWTTAVHALESAAANDPRDRLEQYRVAALQALRGVERRDEQTRALTTALQGFRSNLGTASAWSKADKALIGGALTQLRDLCKASDDEDAADVWALDAQRVVTRAWPVVLRELDRLKREQGVLTFADLERLALHALQHPHVRAYYHARWRHVLIDEFQDTNPTQWAILERVLAGGANVTVVGDEKQSIYAFRRADVTLFRTARERVAAERGVNVHLGTSFRTHAPLVSVTNAFFERRMPGPDDTRPTAATFTPLTAHRAVNPAEPLAPVEFHAVLGKGAPARRAAEANLLAARIQALIAEERLVHGPAGARPVRFGDIAVLFRSRTDLAVYEAALFRAGIPYVVNGGRGLLYRPEVRDARTLLAWLAQPADDLLLASLLRSPYGRVDDADLARLARARTPEETLWQTLARQETLGARLTVARELLRSLLDACAFLRPSRLLALADERSGCSVLMAATSDGERRLANLARFTGLVRAWQSEGGIDLGAVNDRLRQLEVLDVPLAEATLADEDAVTLTTIHGAKGLEYPVVFVPDLLRGKNNNTPSVLHDASVGVAVRVPGVPSAKQPSAYQALLEARQERERSEDERVWYVAFTRAADLLVLSATGEASGGGAASLAALAGDFPDEHVARFSYAAESVPTPEPRRFMRDVTTGRLVLPHAAPLPESLPVTSLSVYLTCPLAFKRQYLLGHARLATLWRANDPDEARANVGGAIIGSAVHRAIELAWTPAEMERHLAYLPDRAREEVARLVSALSGDAYRELRGLEAQRELNVSPVLAGVRFEGVIDALYDGWVVDYKTDKEAAPHHHLPQLAVYAAHVGANRASLAYLRHDRLHDFTEDELRWGLQLAEGAARRMFEGDFEATPSVDTCRWCAYRGSCPSRYIEEI